MVSMQGTVRQKSGILTVDDQSRRALASEEGEPPYDTSLSKGLLSPELLQRNVVLDLLSNLGTQK